MKTIDYWIFKLGSLVALSIILYSCSDFLEVTPKDRISDAALWSNEIHADLFLNNVYAGIQGPFSTHYPGENWSDNSMNGVELTAQRLYAISAYTPSDILRGWDWSVQSEWNYYDFVRRANVFIENVSESNTLSEDWKNKRIAEARFLRAYFYSILATHYGGVPLITNVLNYSTQGEYIFTARSSIDETFQFIIDECGEIANVLPLKTDAGRASRGAALALKGWMELYWASPLYNENNDKTKWAAAAETYKKIMDLGVYDLFPDYGNLFLEDNNNNIEVIFDKPYVGNTPLGSSKTGLQGPAYSQDGAPLSWGALNPTQELVDEYSMANGLPISHPESGYDPQNPYENREKRFYQSIFYDGSEWLGEALIMKQGVGSPNATDLSSSNERTNTGYYSRKGMHPQYTVSGHNQLSSANFIIYRYAEVLLGYAEAQNETVGPDESVYNAINEVRERSDLPPLETGMSQEEMRSAIHRERRVELAFEEKRWYDLLRLKIAEEKLNGDLHAMVIKMVDNEWVYNVIPASGGERIFYPEKNYVLPIPQSAIDRNPKLVQNPNY